MQRAALLVVLIGTLFALGCSEMDGRSTNLFGTVTIDDVEVPGLDVEAESNTGEIFDTITGTDGSFGYIVEPGTYTVRLTSLPDDVSCEEGSEQNAVVLDDETTMLTFTCETDVGATSSAGG